MEQLQFDFNFMCDVVKDMKDQREAAERLIEELDAVCLEIDEIIGRPTPWNNSRT